MFIIYNCSYEIDNLSYNLRNDKKDIDTIIQKYSLFKRGLYKELWENNSQSLELANLEKVHPLVFYLFDQ